MKYLFELSKDHKTIPNAEITSCLKAEKINYNIIESNNDVIIIDTNASKKIKNLGKRLSHTFHIDNFLFFCNNSLDEIKEKALNNKIEQSGSIAIKYKNRSKNVNSQEILKALANIYSKNRKVILNNPDIEIRCLITDSKIYVGKKLVKIDRSIFEKRKVQFRPFFSPVSLHPRIARALVNLSNVKKDDILLDPFCGTGGILLEAGLIGARIIGTDIEEKMISGCKKTLDYFNISNYKLFQSDIGNIDKYVKDIDTIVTDLPYGRSATTKGEHMNLLYQRSFKMINKVLKKGSKAVIGLSNPKSIQQGEDYLTLLDTYEIKANRSLTRYFSVYEKQP
jgi:tRNA (guanine10-N2)-dimethyltransferase